MSFQANCIDKFVLVQPDISCTVSGTFRNSSIFLNDGSKAGSCLMAVINLSATDPVFDGERIPWSDLHLTLVNCLLGVRNPRTHPRISSFVDVERLGPTVGK